MDRLAEEILRRRMHGLYLSRQCGDITELSSHLLGLHCWFHRNVAFSALIRGAPLFGWKTTLTKTWLYRGTLHGVVFDDLPRLLALHADDFSNAWLGISEDQLLEIAGKVVALMEDGVYSRAEMRRIFARDYDQEVIDNIFSPWGGIFVYLARLGKVAFRSMTSRDFDLISAEPADTHNEVLPELLGRFFTAYGPATLADAAWFLGLWREGKKMLAALDLDAFSRLEHGGSVYYYVDYGDDIGDIPELTLLSGFDPLITSYVERGAALPPEVKSSVILKSGICLPTIAVNGQVAGLWNIKKDEPVVTFFKEPSRRIRDETFDLVDDIRRQTAGML